MKKRILFFGGIASLAVPIATIVSCSKSKKTTIESTFNKAIKFEGEKNETKKIGIMVTDPENPRWVKAKKFGEIYGNQVFKSAKVNILKKQSEQNKWIKANKDDFDGLIIAPTDSTAVGSFNTWPQTKPVVAFDKLIKTEDDDARRAYNWYVTYDSKWVGTLQGLFIINKIYGSSYGINTINEFPQKVRELMKHIKNNKLSKEKIILTLAGDPNDNNAKLFFNGAMALLENVEKVDPNFKIPQFYKTFKNVAQDNWNYAKGQTFLKTKIAAMDTIEKKKIAAVLSPNDGLAISTINALNKNGIDPKKVIITGQDANDTAILSISGESNPGQDMTIAKPDSKSMAVAVALLNELIKKNSYNVSPDPSSEEWKILMRKIRSMFSGIEIRYDATYETSPGKTINTILLKPKVIQEDDIGALKLFKIVKK